jgi:hypothetical protein
VKAGSNGAMKSESVGVLQKGSYAAQTTLMT